MLVIKLISPHDCFDKRRSNWLGTSSNYLVDPKLISQAESNMNDLISEYQQYQEATIDDDYDGDGDGEDLEQDEA